MNHSRRLLAGILTLTGLVATGCLFGGKRDAQQADAGSSEDDGTDDPPPSTDPVLVNETKTLTASSATLSSASLLELQNSNSEVSLKGVSTAIHNQCAPGSGGIFWYLSSDNVGSTRNHFAISYQPTSSVVVSQIQLELAKSGSPTGNILVSIYSDSSGDPASALATSAPVAASSVGSYTWMNFDFASAVNLTANTKYHIVLKGDSDFTAPGGVNMIAWSENSTCDTAPFGWERASSDGISWMDVDPSYGFKNKVLGPLHSAASPTASYTADAGASGDWDLSSFSPSENPHGEKGSILYDVGASDDGTAAYSLTGQTAAQVQAAANLTGRYLHVRAALVSDGKQDASLGAITIDVSSLQ